MPTSIPPAAMPRRRLRAVLAIVLAAVVLVTGWSTGRASAAETESGSPVVLIGVTGLRWDDIGSLTTPALWSLSREGSVGTSVVRSTRSFTCPSAGWLAVSAGGRSDDLSVADGTCRTLRDPLPDGAVPGWEDYQAATNASAYDSRLGLLGETVSAAGLTATGIGPGAAIALADAEGTPVGTHLRTPSDTDELRTQVTSALETTDLLVVDAGTVRDPGYQTRGRSGEDGAPAEGEGAAPDVSGTDVVIEPTRAEQVQDIDAQIAAVLTAVQRSADDPTVYVISLADSSRRAHLQLAAATGPAVGGGQYAGGMLSSGSTRQDGFLQVTDVTPTLLSALGIRDQAPSGALVGSVVSQRLDDDTATARVTYLIDQNRHAQAAKPLVSGFYVWWVALNLALYALVTVGLNNRVRQWFVRLLDRWRPNRVRGRLRVTPERVLRTLRIAAVVVSAVPVATFLANLLPWWRSMSPGWALCGTVTGISVLIALLALLPPWRSSFLGPLGTVAGITALVLAWDVATGARLALDSMMGPGSLVAGRFYGFGNPAFALFATAMVLVAIALANPLARRGRRWTAAGVVLLVGLIATVVDGMPSIGADFGGPPALVPGFGIMALLVAGIRLNWRRVLAVLAAGAVVVIGIAMLDYARPADERTHLGRFIETVLDGGLWTVLLRKGQANLGILFGSEQTLLAIGGLLLVVLLLGRPARNAVDAPDGGPYAWLSAGAPLRRLSTDAPVLMPGLVGLAVTLFLGFALNDSGVVVPATGIGMAVPLLVAASATWMLTLQPKGTVVATAAS
ncbi:hypothetical protein [Cellulomonas sp. NPDC089187]|uniref:hypothetical protein n=1 Tax=Cellulomonas sp. NPDC089187 TaxID=3154970 RepID=UPI00343A64F1